MRWVAGTSSRNETKGHMSEKKRAVLAAYYEVGRAAALLDMSPRYVKDRIRGGDLEGYRLGNRIVVTAESLQVFLANRLMGGAD